MIKKGNFKLLFVLLISFVLFFASFFLLINYVSAIQSEWRATCQTGWINTGVYDDKSDSYRDLGEDEDKISRDMRLCLFGEDLTASWKTSCSSDEISTQLWDDKANDCRLDENSGANAYQLCLKSSVLIQSMWDQTCPLTDGWIDTKLVDCAGGTHNCNDKGATWTCITEGYNGKQGLRLCLREITCQYSDWTAGTCAQGSCSQNQRYYHRSKTCNGNVVEETKCQDDASCTGDLTDAYWANMRNEKINNADLDDTVKLIVLGNILGTMPQTQPSQPTQPIPFNIEATWQTSCPSGYDYLNVSDDNDNTHDVTESGSSGGSLKLCVKVNQGIEAKWQKTSPGAEWKDTSLKSKYNTCKLYDNYVGYPKDWAYRLYLKADRLEVSWQTSCPGEWRSTELTDFDNADGHGCGEASRRSGGGKVYLCLKQTTLPDLVVVPPSATVINYTIYKQTNILFWKVSRRWQDLTTSGPLIWKANTSGTFNFKAKVSGTTIEKTSENLIVSSPINNFKPVAKIAKPKQGNMFSVGQSISFEQTSYDVDDNINAVWNFGDSTTEERTECMKQGSNCNTTHNYIVSGQKKISLEVEDERGLKARDEIEILIVEVGVSGSGEINIFANISSPKKNETISGDTVNFNSAGTYIINCSVNCPAGIVDCFDVGTSKCWKLDKNILTLNWSFDNDNNDLRNGNWDIYSNVSKKFTTAGNHVVKLTAGYKNEKSSTTRNFKVVFTIPVCLNGTRWQMPPAGNIEDSLSNCYLEDIYPGTQSCCPLGYVCNITTDKCFEDKKYLCSQFTTKNECKNAGSEIGKYSVEQRTKPGFCTSSKRIGKCTEFYENCRCFWNETQSNCTASWSVTKTCDPGIGGGGNIGNCIFSDIGSPECSEGFITSSWTSSWSGSTLTRPEECTDGYRKIACGSTIKLPFFTWLNFFAALTGVFAVYFIFSKKKKDL